MQPTLRHVLKKAFGAQGTASEQTGPPAPARDIVTVEEEKEGSSEGHEDFDQENGVAESCSQRKVLGTLSNSPPIGGTGAGTHQTRGQDCKGSLSSQRERGQEQPQTLNPFVKLVNRPVGPRDRCTVPPETDDREKRKSLSLKSRKRRLPASPARVSEPSSIKVFKPSGRNPGDPQRSGRLPLTQATTDCLSTEDREILSQYGIGGGDVGPPPSLGDLENFESCTRKGGASGVATMEVGSSDWTGGRRYTWPIHACAHVFLTLKVSTCLQLLVSLSSYLFPGVTRAHCIGMSTCMVAH